MSVLGKLGFIHRRLWQRDGVYRASILFGPAPLFGLVLAGAVWMIISLASRPGLHAAPPQWATPAGLAKYWSRDGDPISVAPSAPLPPAKLGGFVGFETGWRAQTHPIEIPATMDVDVKSTPINGFVLDGPDLDMDQIVPKGPKDTLYVASGISFLAVTKSGVYAISARLEGPRDRPPTASCGWG